MVPSLLCTFVAHITFLHVFFLPPPFILSLSLAFSFSLSLFLSLSLYLCPLFLSVVARHMLSDALYQIFSSWSILLFHTISFHSSYKIHQLSFTTTILRAAWKTSFSLSGQPSSSFPRCFWMNVLSGGQDLAFVFETFSLIYILLWLYFRVHTAYFQCISIVFGIIYIYIY